MARFKSVFFDAEDYRLLDMVNRFPEHAAGIQDGTGYPDYSLFYNALHPHGIKELALSQEIRVAHALVSLLDTLEAGRAKDRISALASLHTDVLSTSRGSFRYNTGRVLIQIMKSLIRARGDTAEQLRLAHDFRRAASGKRRVVRKMLRRYYLLEMPEEWNQITYDHHVHDVNTKGRKSPTHLIMDAWIKGIRNLDVIYYNFVEPEAASELLEAADIMGIKVRVGVEFQAVFRGRPVQIVWEPRGFRDWRETVEFFRNDGAVLALAASGREATAYHHLYILRLLDSYNSSLRFAMGARYGVEPREISRGEFIAFVGQGQSSRTHLSDIIYRRIRDAVDARAAGEEPATAAGEEYARQKSAQELSPDFINREWLNRDRNPLVQPDVSPESREALPEIMRLTPAELVAKLTGVRSPSHIILNLCNLYVEDVLELLYLCRGMISHLEVYNLKNYAEGRMPDLEAVSELQYAINEGSAVALKRLIHNCRSRLSGGSDGDAAEAERPPADCGKDGRHPADCREYGILQAGRGQQFMPDVARPVHDPPPAHDGQQPPAPAGKAPASQLPAHDGQQGDGQQGDRLELFTEILRNIRTLRGFYSDRPLGLRIGSDSTSRSTLFLGMGFAFMETLPARTRRELNGQSFRHRFIPFVQDIKRIVTYTKPRHRAVGFSPTRLLSHLPFLDNLDKEKTSSWRADAKSARYRPGARVAVTLGGVSRDRLREDCGNRAAARPRRRLGPTYLNSVLSNTAKVVFGFLAAALTFRYTQEWWVLAWYGPVIWFAVTGFRNILQSVPAGGGLSRSTLLGWHDYLSWTRLCDSLMYTGISVPLLELLVRTCLLRDGMGIDALNSPVFFYFIMSMVNGLYIAGHNVFRGFPRTAAIGNLFRSALAVPVSVVYSRIALELCLHMGWPVIYLAMGAAVISKLASDTVAAMIEGWADKEEYLKLRSRDYTDSLARLFDCCERLEVLFPEENIADVLSRPGDPDSRAERGLASGVGREAADLKKIVILNALDMMYFWMYQPRARDTLKAMMKEMTEDERMTFAGAQLVLTRVREISRMLVDGLMGLDFARPLAFYLARREQYLEDMSRLTGVNLNQN
ncbi:MAG: hypothetical protein LBR82_04635 [Desulfovibrio sp.]|jgi:hypothetical protein|nr:hypothetical protein [Desulfovibrio sp.]